MKTSLPAYKASCPAKRVKEGRRVRICLGFGDQSGFSQE
jgi:hypothetical protein